MGPADQHPDHHPPSPAPTPVSTSAAAARPPANRPAGTHPPSASPKNLVTLLRLRFRPPKPVLAELFGAAPNTITSAEIWPLLTQAGYYIEPAGPRFTTLAGLTRYAQAHGLDLTPKAKPAR
jgi:hypothetical protein